MRTTTLPHKVVVYLPESRREAEGVRTSLLRLLELAGGMTVQDAVGSWVGDGDNIVEERILPLTIHYGADWLRRYDIERELRHLIRALLNLGEQAVLVEYNGGAVLYEKGD